MERCLVAVLDQREVNRWCRKGHSSRGTPLSLGWWAASLPQAFGGQSRLTTPRSQPSRATFLRIASAERRVFQGSTANVAKNVMAGGCKAADD